MRNLDSGCHFLCNKLNISAMKNVFEKVEVETEIRRIISYFIM